MQGLAAAGHLDDISIARLSDVAVRAPEQVRWIRSGRKRGRAGETGTAAPRSLGKDRVLAYFEKHRNCDVRNALLVRALSSF